MSVSGDQDEGFIVKLRGLPWSATADDILKFFKDCKVLDGKSGIHMTSSREGRPSGEAFVEFEDEEDVECAVHKDREHIGSRYIEVFKVNKVEMDWVIKRSGPTHGNNEDGCVRLRGLPFGCSKEEIAQFFTGLEIVPNGITLLTDYSGRSSGEAYVQFVNKEVAEKALLKHREKIGHRYIEIFRSSLSEVNGVLGYPNRRMGSMNSSGGGGSGGGGGGMYNARPGPYDRGDRFGGGGIGGNGGMGGGGGGGGGGANGRFQSRGSRSFKGANFSSNQNNMSDYNNYDRPSPWLGNNHNGGNMRGGGRSPYEMDSWGDMNNAGGSGIGNSSSSLHSIHMRGLPFKATAMDITDFFKPIIPTNVNLLQDHNGRASGEADVEFASHDDAMRGMTKDKGHMQHRYIELFLNSAGSGGTNNNNNNNSNNNGGGGGAGGFGGPNTRRRI